jgi:tRNA threonylcarbamoyladenosine biosynthesis protein TsaB
VLLLAVDTSGKNGSLALARAEQNAFQVLELVPLAGRMYSAQLIPSLQEALARQRLKKTDIDAFAVASGPGSFTGLRVGLSTAKALSEVLHKPIAAVSVLEAAARVTNVDTHVIVALDAGRKQVFVGDYNFSSKQRQETLVTWEEFFALARTSTARLFSPDATVRESAAAHHLVLETMEMPQADAFARIGYEKLLAGDTTPAELLEANYIRASDAELFSLPKITS